MADGNPLLAIHYSTNNTVRIYELLNGSFALIGAASGFPSSINSTAPEPTNILQWTNDGSRLLVTGRNGTTANVTSVSPAVLGPVTLYSGAITNSTLPINISYGREKNQIYISPVNGSVNATSVGLKVANNGLSALNFSIAPTSMNTVTSVSGSPDANWILYTRSTNSATLAYTNGSNPNGTPIYSTHQQSLGFPTSAAYWSFDSSVVVIVASNGTSAYVYKPVKTVDPETSAITINLELIQQLPNIGTINRVAFSGDTRNVAISYVSSGNYTTVMFKKYGEYIIQQPTQFSNFGQTISFTRDGLHLIDAFTRVMYDFNGTSWSINTTAMSNVIAGGTSVSISPHIANALTETKIYDNAVEKFVKDLSTLDLRMFFLTSSAEFDKTLTNINQIPSEQIITGGDWPEDGLAISISESGGVGVYNINAADSNHPVTSSFIQARYAVIYDFITKQPMMFYDLGSNKIIPVGSNLKIDFRNDNLLTFTR